MSILQNVVFTTCMLTQVSKMIDSYTLTFPITFIHDNPHVVVTIHVAIQGVKVKESIKVHITVYPEMLVVIKLRSFADIGNNRLY